MLKSIKEQARTFEEKTMRTAQQANLVYVLCMWEPSFLKGKVEHRVAYFEDIPEAEYMKAYFAKTYSKFDYPYYIATSYGAIEDGGLFKVANRRKGE